MNESNCLECKTYIESEPYNECNKCLNNSHFIKDVEPVEEVCEYTYTNKNQVALKGCIDVWDDTFIVHRWKYCPYCGKPRKIRNWE